MTIERGHRHDEEPPHPGTLLRENVLAPLGIEVTDAAQRLGMARTTLSRVINGRAGISPDLALRLLAGLVVILWRCSWHVVRVCLGDGSYPVVFPGCRKQLGIGE